MATLVPIFHTGRCGSTVLSDMLARTPGVSSGGEIISVNFRKALAEDPAADPVRFLQEHLARRGNKNTKIKTHFFEVKFLSSVDAKHFPGGLKQIVKLLADAGVTDSVILGRSNSLRRICSSLMAIARGQHQARVGETVIVPKVTVPVQSIWLLGGKTLRDTLQQIDDEYDLLRSTLADHVIESLSITYEDDIEKDPAVAYQKVCDRVGISRESLSPAFKRINSSPLSEVIVNYESVLDHLRGTRFEWMLESGLNR